MPSCATDHTVIHMCLCCQPVFEMRESGGLGPPIRHEGPPIRKKNVRLGVPHVIVVPM